MIPVRSSEITPESVYLSRRNFMKGVAAAGLTSVALAACGSKPAAKPTPAAVPGVNMTPRASAATDELGDALTPYDAVTTYNNFYEFSEDKETVARVSQNFQTSPWTVTVGGLVNKPKTYDVADLERLFSPEERIYRLRCVEAWSMVIPWNGFPLAKLLKDVEPTSQAQYVRFETLFDQKQFPGQKSPWYSWPYVEGLRMDEAMNNLAIIATGLYGRPLPAQDGAPVRLVVPWKYGFKSIKSIVKIDLVDKQPASLWMEASPGEYGFYANVNPQVNHPRWSQASERRIGEGGRRKTLMFNGYTDEVASLYTNLDLKANF
jgi:methionine sulfoxide reductase catalytic subunit